ncbi:ABC transporter permease [Rhodoglobus aureus]|uniref:ABC transporter permease n=1 Tax=Rhodoglobus aureus TaxID=191497 RepID=A0ABN1VJT3_9MICO
MSTKTVARPGALAFLKSRRNIALGLALLVALFVIGSITVPGFLSDVNVRSMLLLGAFLGLASVGQTASALLGGLDLSIAYVIGAVNILMVFLMSLGVPAGLAIVTLLGAGLVIGAINGMLSFRLQNQSLVVTLGVGFVVVGLAQVLVSLGVKGTSASGQIPKWMSNFSSVNGTTFGLPVPPIVVVWVILSVAIIALMRTTWFGRSIYALGGNRSAARLMLISERSRWISVYAISGLFSAATGIVLLGFSGGSFVHVGDPYLFLTVAAVAVGGTSLLGGRGGYGSTILGVLVLMVLQSLLVGYGLNNPAQQFVLGLLIVPLVGFYARNPHIRNQI